MVLFQGFQVALFRSAALSIKDALRVIAVLCLVAFGQFALTSCGPAQAAAEAGSVRITSVEAKAESGRTIVTIAYSGAVGDALNARIFALPSPEPRLVFDFPRLNFTMGSQGTGREAGQGLVRQIRWANTSDTVSRIVLDLSGPVKIAREEILGGIGGSRLRYELESASNAVFAQVRSTRPMPSGAGSGAMPVSVQPTVFSPPRPKGPITVVIDAGHGGKDPGATGAAKTLEKDITLASAILLRDLLRATGRYRVVLTRETDVFVTLERRVKIARDANAALFISLHADSGGPTAEGASIYTLSDAGGERARSLMSRQDWLVDAAQQHSGEVSEILTDLTQRDTRNQSAAFAQTLLPQLEQAGPMLRNTHRHAGFFVLLAPDVAAILLEMGFLSSPTDEKRLKDPVFRRNQMLAVSRAIDQHFGASQAVASAR